MELHWGYIKIGKLVENHAQYQIRQVYADRRRIFIQLPSTACGAVGAHGNNPLCKLTPIGHYAGSPFYAFVGLQQRPSQTAPVIDSKPPQDIRQTVCLRGLCAVIAGRPDLRMHWSELATGVVVESTSFREIRRLSLGDGYLFIEIDRFNQAFAEVWEQDSLCMLSLKSDYDGAPLYELRDIAFATAPIPEPALG